MNGLLLPLMTANIGLAFRQSELNGKVIVLVLVFISIGAWTVMLTKFAQLRAARLASNRFLKTFRGESYVTNLFIKRHHAPDTPLSAMYDAGCQALRAELKADGIERPEDLFAGKTDTAETRKLDSSQMDAIRSAVDCALADKALELESLMGLLGTVVSVGPFLGLLGTVWGVMGTFSGMATAGSATLSAVAPGISGALLCTVAGLLVALPATIGYTLLSTRIRYLAVQMDNFAQEFTGRIQQEFMLNRK
ncbi:MAG TPA: MotA/TolQ/ExbB proton channel family protein [Pontiellaceae bacterium]|nr:MotA/TolQ/ExbB proton channel family protein [Pontiellaceae bacterium]HPR82255.1 MotA/TolQ/ExbB proton channel family protein [Pontiellaceae bacterium]